VNLVDVLANRNDYTKSASDASRQLAFAGIAAIWLLRVGVDAPKVPDDLVPALGFFALSLALDLLHYVIASLVWTGILWWKEYKKVRRNKQFLISGWLNAPAYALFFLKVGSVLFGYLLVIVYLIRTWGLEKFLAF